MKKSPVFEDFVVLMAALRDPETGCPWDLEQDFRSLRGYLLEECHETLDALDREDMDELRDELGDLLLQIVFLSRIAEERGAFRAADVVAAISEKMIRRHPHVFGERDARDAGEVLEQWEAIKREEREARGVAVSTGLLDGIPRSLPSLLEALRLGERASRVGFDWDCAGAVFEKIREELDEVAAVADGGDAAARDEEIGDLLFAVAMLARKLGTDPERALDEANRKFRRRFAALESRARAETVPLEDVGAERLESWWEQVKRDETPR